jgi:tRNA U34 5-methylaminomethyl-2-thiouridine-forming methyltransferase MnmC
LLKLLITNDGSHTLFNTDLQESYHSIHGAIQESQYIYIEQGLGNIAKKEISVLEVGFGTGLNAFLSLDFARHYKIKINYTAIESHPLSQDIINKLNYPAQLGLDKKEFLALHQDNWDKAIIFDQYFNITKHHATVEALKIKGVFDLIFFDAFGPNVQPDIWAEQVFQKLNKHLFKGGLLITYSAKGSVKRALKKSGFALESLPGPIGKREITRAQKTN